MTLREALLKEIETMSEENLRELLEYARWLRAEEFTQVPNAETSVVRRKRKSRQHWEEK